MKEIFMKTQKGQGTLLCQQPYLLEARSIEREIKRLWGVEIDDLAQLFWDGEYCNDSCKMLFFREKRLPHSKEKIYDYYTNWEKEQVALRNSVRDFLDHYVEESYLYDYIVVNISW